ncbi:hypothetical protein DX873_14875 [Flagellimonas nanhaiensis]|uniref:Uncharacterized protein n=1 Tax=Flagellimonas nanhaiensis TaxID=2292706 RepID=A0A371JMI8_9FLAO|nr:hypothetical protein DX873_14875 [Allomuricauda nanhaiensis]
MALRIKPLGLIQVLEGSNHNFNAMKHIHLFVFFFAFLSLGSIEYVEAQIVRTPQERRVIRRKVVDIIAGLLEEL